MKASLINDFRPETGAGNYAFSLYKELRRLDPEVGMVFLESEQALTPGDDEQEIIKLQGKTLPVLNRTLNNLYVFPDKLPQDLELYHATNQFLGKVALKRTPCIVTCLDIIPLVLKNDYPWLLRKFLGKAIESMASAEKILTISEFTKRELEEKLGFEANKLENVYLGFDERAFKARDKEKAREKLGLPLDKKLVLHVGSEEPRKNLPSLLNALKIVEREEPEILFVRVGEKRKETLKLAQELGLEKKVDYHASVPLAKLGLYYNAADAFAFPSYYEGFGFPVLEAMASGCPSITSNTASLPEVAGKACLSLDPFDVEGMAQGIKRIISSDSLSQKLSRQGLLQSKNFSWKSCAKKTFKAYQEVIG
jgi:glycosyltransferase involved in cell wall biosynthesis